MGRIVADWKSYRAISTFISAYFHTVLCVLFCARLGLLPVEIPFNRALGPVLCLNFYHGKLEVSISVVGALQSPSPGVWLVLVLGASLSRLWV